MSIAAATLILMITLVRTLAIHKLPKRIFMLLWGVAWLRLLIPFSIRIPVPGIASNIHGASEIIAAMPNLAPFYTVMAATDNYMPDTNTFPFAALWLVGVLVFALFFIHTHYRCRREYKASLPVNNVCIDNWLRGLRLKRTIYVRQSDKIIAPLTYGIWKPVILFPKSTNWEDETGIRYVLSHELSHIRRFDTLLKWLLAAALCIHWFNPLVWVMYVLACRDIELSCDEAVVSAFGDKTKSAYALALINLEENRGAMSPLCASFAKNAIEERIVSIMKSKKISFVAIFLTILLVIGATAVFARTAVYEPAYGYREQDWQDELASVFAVIYENDYIHDGVMTALDGAFMGTPFSPSGEIDWAEIDRLKQRWDHVYVQSTSKQAWESMMNRVLDEYQGFGLTVDNENGNIYYQGQPVAYIHDGWLSDLAFHLNHYSGIGVYAIRNAERELQGFRVRV